MRRRARQGSGDPAARRVRLALCVLCVGAAASGCSIVPGLIEPAADIQTTGSIGAPNALSAALGAADAGPAGDALDKALDPRSAGNPVNWTSSAGARSGSFAAVGEAYLRDDRLCRGFIASVAADGSRSWLRGTACRMGAGPWSLGSLTPMDAKN